MSESPAKNVSVQELLGFARELPSSPAIFARINRLYGDPAASLDAFADIIRMDAVLSAQVLRLANSAYFGFPIKVLDLEEALFRLGYRELHRLVGSVIVRQSFINDLAFYDIRAAEYEEMSIACAVASEVVALRTGIDPNTCYITGLFHAIGLLAISEYMRRKELLPVRKWDREKAPITEYEQKWVGLTHAEVGANLLSFWQFAKNISVPVQFQHDPAKAPECVPETNLLYLAGWIVKQMGKSPGPVPDPHPTLEQCLSKLGLSQNDLTTCLETSNDQFEKARKLLQQF